MAVPLVFPPCTSRVRHIVESLPQKDSQAHHRCVALVSRVVTRPVKVNRRTEVEHRPHGSASHFPACSFALQSPNTSCSIRSMGTLGARLGDVGTVSGMHAVGSHRCTREYSAECMSSMQSSRAQPLCHMLSLPASPITFYAMLRQHLPKPSFHCS